MGNISFVAWMVLYPLAESITLYLYFKRCKIFNQEKPSDGVVAFASLINTIIWIVIGVNLYN